MTTRYVFHARVLGVDERFVKHYIGGKGDQAKFQTESVGWFVQLKGSQEALYIGDIKPELEVGNIARVTIEKVSDGNT